MKAYIKSSSAISAQASINGTYPWSELSHYENFFTAIEPNYKDYVPAMKLRRMGRLVKMALISAVDCVNKAGVKNPGGIISSSGWGCLTDTYEFLADITKEGDEPPWPATFINSTHNTPGGQIALYLECQNYNNVIVNGNTSFELALEDALMLLAEGKDNILVGGYDEITTIDYELKERSGYWKITDRDSSSFLSSETLGTMAGEGSAFVLLSTDSDSSSAMIKDAVVKNGGPESNVFDHLLNDFLEQNNMALNDIDLVLSGANGDRRIMPYYKNLYSGVFNNTEVFEYKSLCGEYDTASSFGVWLANEIIKSQVLPLENNKHQKEIKNILLFNYASSYKHAFILVSKTGL